MLFRSMRDDCTGIDGLDADEAAALIAALADHIVKPAHIYRHRWQVGDVLMWDNRCLLHRAEANFDAARHARVLHRTCLRGGAPA